MRSFDPTAYPDRLNLGCGFDHRKGYLNVDINHAHDPDLVADITDLHVLPDRRYREVVAQDVLEHLPRTATVAVLREWRRLLCDGGLLHLRVPSLIDLTRLVTATENQAIERQEVLVQNLFGTQAYTEDTHLTTFTEPLLRHYLAQAGFEVTRWDLWDTWLFDVDAHRVAIGRAGRAPSGEEVMDGERRPLAYEGPDLDPGDDVSAQGESLTEHVARLEADIARLGAELREAHATLTVIQNMKVVRWTVWPRRIVYRLRARGG